MARARRLPSRFPIGTHYVVEGVPGEDGELLITSRRVVFPDGFQLELPLTESRASAARRGRRRQRAGVRRVIRG